jgi:ATP-dependent Clp protease ATP-binding subunit ClpA
MPKSRDRETLEHINATYDALFNDVAEMPTQEVRRALRDLGADHEVLRESLHKLANQLARSLRAAGHSAPPYLLRVIEQSADAKELPKDPKRALEKAKKYLADLFEPASPQGPEIIAAFRGDGELSERDHETIDELEAELRRRAETEGEEGQR